MDIQLFLLLLGGHYLADFGLQSQHMAEKKAKTFIEPAGFHSLTAHAAIHGLVAGLITQSVGVGLFVVFTHWLIDFCKASELITDKFPHTKGARRYGQKHGMYGLHLDQTLHILMLVIVVIVKS